MNKNLFKIGSGNVIKLWFLLTAFISLSGLEVMSDGLAMTGILLSIASLDSDCFEKGKLLSLFMTLVLGLCLAICFMVLLSIVGVI